MVIEGCWKHPTFYSIHLGNGSGSDNFHNQGSSNSRSGRENGIFWMLDGTRKMQLLFKGVEGGQKKGRGIEG